MNIDASKSYATEFNLMEAIKRVGLADCKPLVVRNREGRWTAIFTQGRMDQAGVPLHVAPSAGFMIVN